MVENHKYYASVSIGKWDALPIIFGLTSDIEAVVESDGFSVRFIEISKDEFETYDYWCNDDRMQMAVLERPSLKPVKKIELAVEVPGNGLRKPSSPRGYKREEFSDVIRLNYEITHYESMLAQIPLDMVIYRGSLQSKVEELYLELDSLGSVPKG